MAVLIRASARLAFDHSKWLGNIAHGVNRTVHLLFANNDVVEQAFKLRRHSSGVDQCWIGAFENAGQRQACLGRHDVLSLGNQKTLFRQPTDDLGSGRRRANALGFLQPFPQSLIINKAPGICIASIRVPSL
jgi:hypothetical protein